MKVHLVVVVFASLFLIAEKPVVITITVEERLLWIVLVFLSCWFRRGDVISPYLDN